MEIHILLVEDNENDALLIHRQLKKSGITGEFTRVETLAEVSEALQQNEFDLVISDYNLPGFSGLDVLYTLKHEKIDIPFILISGTIGDIAAVSIMKAGATDYILKDNLMKLPEVVKREIEENEVRNQNKRLEINAKKLSEIIRSDGSLILTFDSDLTINFINQKAETELQIDSDEDPLNFRSFLSPKYNQQFFNEILPTTKSHGSWNGEIEIVKTSGEELPVLCSFVFHANGALSNEISIIAKDISVIKKQEKEIIELNRTLEERVAIRTIELNNSLNEILYKNQEILDSINYAHRIQDSLIHKKTDLEEIFPNSFGLSLPKDIVSGDFFWCHQDDSLKYISLIDCTGHGVPGALLSIVANQIINKVVNEKKYSDTYQILNYINLEMENTFRFSNSTIHINDGIDMAFCIIDETKHHIQFSGANRPAWILSDGEIEEHEGTKRSIGQSDIQISKKTFDQSIINYKKGDILYLFSDGYYSQFGGEKGKKLNKELFKKLLISTSSHFSQQEDKLNSFFLNWKQDYEQIDDVCVIGILL